MLKKVLFLIVIFFIFGYRFLPEYEKMNFIIDLKQETNDSIYLDFAYRNFHLSSLDRVPKFQKKVMENYRGIPINDSILFYGNFENRGQFYYDLYRNQEYDKVDFLKFITERDIDTLEFSKKPLLQGLISVVGFYKNKQFIISDANRNLDFGDDIQYEFDINYRKNKSDSSDILKGLPTTEYFYEYYKKGKIQTYRRKFILYPFMNGPRPFNLNTKEMEYLSFILYKDYWKGEQLFENKMYEFYFQGLENSSGVIYIKLKNIPFSKNDIVYNDQFKYYTNDTLPIAGNYYKIDSINSSISKLYLRKLQNKADRYGTDVGSYLHNIEFENLENTSNLKLSEITAEKKYTLIEFWNINCAPCRLLPPKFKRLKQKFSSKLNIISIAHDYDKKEVKDFVAKHEMDWINGFISNNRDDKVNPIIKQLKIQYVPTLILLDSNNKILFRGSTCDEIEKYLK